MTERAKKLLLLYYKQSRKIRRVSGLPPLTFKAKKAGTLKNYRIYGQTVDGESVGDRTGNLFDRTHNTIPHAILVTGAIDVGDGYLIYAPITPLQTYTFSTNGTIRLGLRSAFTINKPAVRGSYVIDDVNTHINHDTNNKFTRQAPLNANWIVIQIRDESALAYDNMLNEGSTALPYEPYGYKIPVTLTADSAETTDIYLDEPLAKSGNNADYIDYAAQKRHNSDGTESSVTLPEISTLSGTNTLTVGTEVQPSGVEIKGRIKAAGGD